MLASTLDLGRGLCAHTRGRVKSAAYGAPIASRLRPIALTAVQRADRGNAIEFTRGRAWAPATETIDDIDHKKRIQIALRFEDADKDNNGRIDMEELRALLESTSSDTVAGDLSEHWLSAFDVTRLMSLYDTDSSGDLDAQEFQKLVNDVLLWDEKLSDYQAAFQVVDTDRSGDISASELGQLLARLGWSATDCSIQRAQELMERYGTNAAGNLDFNSFMGLVKHEMLDVREVLAYMGARPASPQTTRSVINAVSDENFTLVTSEDDLDTALLRSGDKVVLLMAGTTWCAASRAMVNHVKALASAYPSVVVLMLWGNESDGTKELFRDRLMVRSTPAFFIFRGGELLSHWAGGDAAKLESELRHRVPADPDMPAVPLY